MQNQPLFETPFVSEMGTTYYSKCTRSGTGKCMCKRCRGDISPSLSPNGSNPGYAAQWLFEPPFPSPGVHHSASTQERYGDAMSSPPFRAISSWPSLLKRAIQAIQNAMRHLVPPGNMRGFDIALLQAETFLENAMKEARKVMAGSRQFAVLDQLSNAVIRIQAARAQARGSSIFGGRSLIDPKMSLYGAINHIQQARRAVGLATVQ